MAGLDFQPLNDRTLALSVRRLAEEFQIGREAVAKRLHTAGVRPAGTRQGHPVYRIADAAKAILEVDRQASADFDPAMLPPMERRAWYQSENERLGVEEHMRRLIPALEVEAEMALLAKTVVRALETIPDTVERDLRVSPEVVEYLQEKVHRLRAEITSRLVEADAAEGEA